MTSDAKIGLLLGLVFIFVIAFIINGLPNLRPQQTTHADDLKVTTFPDQGIGIVDAEQAQIERDWNALVNEQEPVAEAVAPVVESPQPTAEAPSTQAPAANAQDVRYESPLPRIEDLLHRINDTLIKQREQASTFVPAPASDQPAPVERQPTVAASQPKPDVTPAPTVARSTEQPKPPVTTPTTPRPAGRIYVVGEGESLSTVAKKVYGAEEGNRIVNIRRIYEANKDILKSEHEVTAGQKLVIPPAAPNPNKPADVLPKQLFEKVEQLGKRPASQPAATSPAASPTASATGRWYTVQDGDNLWKIASSQLGAGARYEEIAKLNADLLKNGEKLDVGMKIRLPLK